MAQRTNFNIKHSTVGVYYNNSIGRRYLSDKVIAITTVTYVIVKDDNTMNRALSIFTGKLDEDQVRAALDNK